MNESNSNLPRLRPLDFKPFRQDGRVSILLRDPLQLSEKMVAVPQQLAPALALMDGTRDADGLRAALIVEYQLLVGTQVLSRLIEVCDEAFLLDNERYHAALADARRAYRDAPFRPPALVGASYPADPGELRALLDSYLDLADDVNPNHAGGSGLISPHIDYPRGGPVYARVWKSAAEMAQAADLAVVLGTDHYGGRGTLTLTRQHYATPFGTLPTAVDVVDAVVAAIGEERAFAEELHHKSEHSIELAVVWLHHMRGGRPIELVPVLCGGYSHFVEGKVEPAQDPVIAAFVESVKAATAGRRAIVIAAGDLSHVGPAFGGQPQGIIERARLRMADEEILARTCEGDAEGFFSAIRRVGDRHNVCGLPPIYVTLRLLGAVHGEQVGYDRCPADDNETSFVSIGGVVFTPQETR